MKVASIRTLNSAPAPPPPLTHCLQAITGTRVFKNVLKQAEGFGKYKERKKFPKSPYMF